MPGGQRLRPSRFTLLAKCTKNCSLNKANLGDERAQMVHGWFEDGLNNDKIGQMAYQAGFEVSSSALARHKANHLLKGGEITDSPAAEMPEGEELGDLEALDLILKVGSRQINNWKVTPSDFFKAMDMKYKLTQGSAFQGMLEALAVAEDEEEDE